MVISFHTMETQIKTKKSIEIHDRPGNYWSDEQRITYTTDLRALGSECLSPLPEYQCFSTAKDAFDDKLLVIVRNHTSKVIAFTSALYMDVPQVGFVLHTGLTCVAPQARNGRLTMLLFYKAFTYMTTKYPQGFWITNLGEGLSGLANIGRLAKQVYPSPYTSQPSATHLAIAADVSANWRSQMRISSNAYFDKDNFVFRTSNPHGSPFRKDMDDSTFHHREQKENDFYKALVRPNHGDEVLQVGYIDPEWNRIRNLQEVVAMVRTPYSLSIPSSQLYCIC